MGGCLGSNSMQLGYKQPFDQEPTDTATLKPENYAPVNFKALFTKLKLKWCSYYKHVSIRIHFGKYQQFELKSKYIVNQVAKWDIYHEFDFMASEYDLRKEFMLLTFFDEHEKNLGHLKINLYLLATGPYHQDFAVPLVKAESARLCFNLKIAQEVIIQMYAKEASLTLFDRQFPGDVFAFGVNLVMGDRAEQSQLSYKFVVDFKQGQISEQRSSQIHSSNEKKTTAEREHGHVKSIRKTISREDWEGNASTHKNQKDGKGWTIRWNQSHGKMPTVKVLVPLFDLHGASFNIIFYNFRNKKHEFNSQCFLSYNKMASFQYQERLDPPTKKMYEERRINIESPVWDHGKQTGQARFTFLFALERHIKQMQLCVRTERGILQSSPVFGESGGSKMPKEMIQLEKLSTKIQNQFVKVAKESLNQNNKQEWVSQINKDLQQMQTILVSSIKETQYTFLYNDENSLLKAQKGLIEISKRIRSLLDEDKQQIAPNCWLLLIALMRRGQFSLANIGFKAQQIDKLLTGKPSQFLQQKKEVALSYYILLVDLLQRTLKSLENFNYESQREFAQLFCAFAYFRLPKFRNQVLAIITRSNDPFIEEWRGTEYSLTEKQIEASDRESSFRLMFDWENGFYKVLEGEEDYSKTEAKLLLLMKTNDWQDRMQKRGGAFFAFVRYWVTYIQTIAVNSKHISWRYFPGYNKILLSFLAEMKLRPLNGYSDPMKRAATSLLTNQKLLNPFVLIVFKKTNQYDQLSVVKAFDLLGLFLSSIRNKGRNLPGTFDFKLLLKSIQDILKGDSAFPIGKVLVMLYDNFTTFPVEFRIEISGYIMTRVFFKLFLHWSHNVRTIFHHLFFIRIYHEASKPFDQLDPKEQDIYRYNPQFRTSIENRYKKLMMILENVKENKHKIQGRKIDGFESDTYKRLRRKVQDKLRGKTNPPPQSKRAHFDNDEAYYRQLMRQLAEPKLERYNSELMSRNLKVVVENMKEKTEKESVIIHSTLFSKTASDDGARKRKINVKDVNFQEQLVAIKEEEIPYVETALEQFNKINDLFIKKIEKNNDSIPVVRLELSLDEKELRPDGLTDYEEW